MFIGLTGKMTNDLLMVNFNLVKYYVSSRFDDSTGTSIMFIDGLKIIVKESTEQIDELIKNKS
jgi:hypothetical protein